MKFRGESTIQIIKGTNDEYTIKLECSNCKYVQVLEGHKDTVWDYNMVKELTKSFIDDECLCLECYMEQKNE